MSKSLRGVFFLCLALAGGLSARPAGADGLYCLRFSSDPKPILYLQFKGDSLQIASTPEGLASAKAIPGRISQGGGNYQSMVFPQQRLPLAAGPETKARFILSGAILRADYDIMKKDAAGIAWHFLLHSGLPQPETIVLPDLHSLTLNIKTMPIVFEGEKIAGTRLGIGLLLQSGETKIDNVRKNDRPANCMVSVTADDGKFIVTAQGGLGEKFGFG